MAFDDHTANPANSKNSNSPDNIDKSDKSSASQIESSVLSDNHVPSIHPRPVLMNDVTLRDAHQSLLATRMRIDDLVGIAKIADKCGFNALETWGGATFDVAIRFKGENPWENLRQLKKAAPKTDFMMLLRGQSLVGYKNYPDDVVNAFITQAAENGINIFRIFDALNDERNLQAPIAAVKALQAAGKRVFAQGTLCYSTSPVHNIPYYIKKAKILADMGCDSICIKDMAGLLEPDIARDLIPAIKTASGLPVVLHMHATMGLSDASILQAIKAGIDVVDVASRGIGGGPGHSASTTILEILRHDKDLQGFLNPSIDYDKILQMDAAARSVRPKYSAFESAHNKDRVDQLLAAQVPGGMLSNFENQIRQQILPLGIDFKQAMDKILQEIPRVREDFGWPPLVTPASQIIGVQAVFNVIQGFQAERSQGAGSFDQGRYKILPESSLSLLLGELGQPPAPANPDLIARAEKETGRQFISHRPADELVPGLDKTRQIMHDYPKCNLDDGNIEDVLIVALWDQLGLDFLSFENECSDQMSSHEAPPSLPDDYSLTSSQQIDGQSVIGPGDVAQMIGVDHIEYLAQSCLELTKLQDGTWKFLSDKIKAKRLDRVKARISHEYAVAKSAISAHILDQAQRYAVQNLLHTILKGRCQKLGANFAENLLT